MEVDQRMMRLALRLARRGRTSPNPKVGAVLVRRGRIIGQGWHHRAGEPHAEIEALRAAAARGANPAGATLYVTLEPCCTHGRTPPCTDAILDAGIKRVVAGATDPNPAHRGRGFRILRQHGIEVRTGICEDEATSLNEGFNHWIVHRMPFVTVKSAMTLDGKIATAAGESKWITGPRSRDWAMKLREDADAILVGISTVLADDPALTVRLPAGPRGIRVAPKRRIILDSLARTPLTAHVVSDEFRGLTTVVVSRTAPQRRVAALDKRVRVLIAPVRGGRLDLRWMLRRLGAEEVTSLLVEGGGEVNASFLLDGLAHRVVFFYAPIVLGGRDALKAVGGDGIEHASQMIRLRDPQWRKLGPDLLLTACVG
jgi:diaminohydroxyphosphoribosylaminopyrimidine deaminase/5-amino-6-(5-phosphoribosylamino)uracil reductase